MKKYQFMLIALLVIGLTNCSAERISNRKTGVVDVSKGDAEHQELDMGPGYKIPDIAPIRVMADGKEVAITLADAFEYHGDLCPGVTFAFRTMRLAIKLLWDGRAPERNDMIVFSRGPMYGVLDMFNLVTRGNLKADIDATTQATPGPRIPEGMKPGLDRFYFTIIRRTTGSAINLKAHKRLFPRDFFSLRKKIKSKKATTEEKKRFNSYKRNLVKKIPAMPVDKLFEKPIRYKVITWGI